MKPTPPQMPIKPALAEHVDLASHAICLRRVIVSLSEKSHSQVKAILDAYLRHIHPTLAEKGDTMFPHSVKRHPINPERTTQSVWGSVLCFHVGNAILGFYDLVLAIRNGNEAFMDGAALQLMGRIAKLEKINAEGMAECYIQGDAGTGFEFVTRREMEESRRAAQAVTDLKMSKL